MAISTLLPGNRTRRRWPKALRTLLPTLAAATAVYVSAGAAKPSFPVSAVSSAQASSPTASTVSLPATVPGAQARWLLGALAHLPIPVASIEAHFDAAFLAQVTPAQLNSAAEQIGPLRLLSVMTSQPEDIVLLAESANSTQFKVTLAVDGKGLIDGLLFQPETSSVVPTTWAGVDALVRSVAPRVHLLVARISAGACLPVHSIDPGSPAPLGSAFKLYVLDALARAVASGRARWDEKIALTSQVKSLPSGQLQNDPTGTRLSVLQVATDMISISDNTAADMLIGLVGRSAVEAATGSSGMADPHLDVPFLKTRELFVLKLDDWPHLANEYLSLNSTADRLAFLTRTIDRDPLPPLAAASAWTAPRDIDFLEWFASANDICRAYASLQAAASHPALANVARVLEVNDGGLGLPTSQWKSVWFKGGSEPGVLTLNYLATTLTGQT